MSDLLGLPCKHGVDATVCEPCAAMPTIEDLDEVMYDGIAHRHLTHDGRETPHGEPLALCGAFGVVNWQGGRRCPSCAIHAEAMTGHPWPDRPGVTPP